MTNAISTRFTVPASEETLQATAAALGAHNIEARIVDGAADARAQVLELVPEGAQVHSGKSKTIEDLGLFAVFEAGAYDWVRARFLKMDRRTQGREIARLIATPDYMLGSAQALTRAGALYFASYSASQLGPIAAGAARLILVVGGQKIVEDGAEAMRRIEEHVFPYEDARLREQLGVPTKLAKLLIVNAEAAPGRTTVILTREPVGV